MKKNKCYYEDEKLKLFHFIMPSIGIVLMIYFTVLKIMHPDNWSQYGYVLAMGFMFFWTWITFGFTYYKTIKPRYIFLKHRNEIMTNGSMLKGEIINTRKEVKLYTNNIPSAWSYYAEIKIDDGIEEKTFWTPKLLINTDNLDSKDVLVYTYNNKYYTTDFKVSNNPIKIKIHEEKTKYTEDNNTSAFTNVGYIIPGIIFTYFTGWVFINAADLITRISITPFLLAGIGLFLNGVLPLIFYKNVNKVKNIGMKIYLLAFGLFWFGFLIVFDYLAIRDGSIKLLLFSLIFWVAGIFGVVVKFKEFR